MASAIGGPEEESSIVPPTYVMEAQEDGIQYMDTNVQLCITVCCLLVCCKLGWVFHMLWSRGILPEREHQSVNCNSV